MLMMAAESLSEVLARINKSNCDGIPTPQLAILRRAVARLRRSGILERCLQVGETAADFEFINARNEQSCLYRLLSTGPVVINFFRGFWCSYCEQELKAYEQVLSRIQELGAHYLALAPHQQKPAHSTDYHLVCDCDNQIARAFGIVYELTTEEKRLFSDWNLLIDEVNQSSRWELPLPASYVIRQDHSIGFQFVDADFRCRLDPEEIIEFLRSNPGNTVRIA